MKKRKEDNRSKPNEGESRAILMMLDEFPQIGKIPDIINSLAVLRYKKVTICLIAQSLAQLEMIYGRDARKVIADNCTFKAVLGATDAETQEYFSKLVGTYEKLKTQYNQNYSPFDIHSGSGRQSSYDDGKPIIRPEEFATLQNELILLYPMPSNFCRVQKQPYYLEKCE